MSCASFASSGLWTLSYFLLFALSGSIVVVLRLKHIRYLRADTIRCLRTNKKEMMQRRLWMQRARACLSLEHASLRKNSISELKLRKSLLATPGRTFSETFTFQDSSFLGVPEVQENAGPGIGIS